MAHGVSFSATAFAHADRPLSDGPVIFPLLRARPMDGYDDATGLTTRDRIDAYAERRAYESLDTSLFFAANGCGSNPHLNAADMMGDRDSHLPNIVCSYHSPRQLTWERDSQREAGRLRDTYYTPKEAHVFATDPSLPTLGESVLLALGKPVPPPPALPAGAFVPSLETIARVDGRVAADVFRDRGVPSGPAVPARMAVVRGLGADTTLGRGVAVVGGVLSAGHAGMSRFPTSVFDIRSSD